MSSVLFEGCASSGVKYCIGIVFDVNFFLSPLLTAILGIYYIVHLFFFAMFNGERCFFYRTSYDTRPLIVRYTISYRTMHDLISYDARVAKP